MGKTVRHEKEWEPEVEFPYIPVGVPVVSTGRAYDAEDNRAFVRALLASKQPRFAAAVERAVKELNNDV